MKIPSSVFVAAGLVSLPLLAAADPESSGSRMATSSWIRLSDDPPPADRTDVPLDDPRHVDDASDLPPREQTYSDMQGLYGDRFGGIWVDRSVAPSVFRVNVVKADAVDSARLAIAFKGSPRVVLQSVKFSFKQLTDFKEKLTLSLSDWREYLVGIDVPGNKVRVKVPRATSASSVDRVFATVPSEAVNVSRDYQRSGSTIAREDVPR